MCSGINLGKFASVYWGGAVSRVNLLNEGLLCIELEKEDRNLLPLFDLRSNLIVLSLYDMANTIPVFRNIYF